MEIEPKVARLIVAAEKGKGFKPNEAVEEFGILGAVYQSHLKFNDDAMASQIKADVQEWVNFKSGVLRGDEFAKIAVKFLVYMKERE